MLGLSIIDLFQVNMISKKGIVLECCRWSSCCMAADVLLSINPQQRATRKIILGAFLPELELGNEAQ